MTTSYDTFKKTDSYVEGTVKELVAHNIKANGIALDSASLGVLIQLGMGELIGTAPKPAGQKGKSAKVYRIAYYQSCTFTTSEDGFDFSLKETGEMQETV